MFHELLLLLAVLMLTFCQTNASPSAPNGKDSEEISYRLPNTVFPELYRLDILTNIADINENFTFQGRACIQIVCISPTDKIILHSKNLQIHESEVSVILNSDVTSSSDDSGKEENAEMCNKMCNKKCEEEKKNFLKILNHCYHDDYELYIIYLNEKLKAGSKYTIYIPYDGELRPDLAGFYRSSYKDLKTNEVKWMAVTQFESTDARRAFPCFDEPMFKARFQVNLGHINKRTSISNMRQMSSSTIQGMEGWVWDHYEVTVPMSTYLLAFVISDFECKIAQDSPKSVLFRVWARKDAIDQVDYANTVGPKVLSYYEKYFSVEYPLPKMDMIAIPDFNSGAMENWGLVTYREIALLYDPNISTTSTQPYVASVIAHELAHQWFGNLVTMKWWTDLWLNEGFATYVAGLGVHHLYPEWNSLDEEVLDNAFSVFSLDSLKSSHPISVPIGHPREIRQIFDAISYKKGSFVIRMMNLFLGENTFREGVSNYLKKNAYGNAEQDDLWESLSQAAHKNNALSPSISVKEIMDTWTLQTGYPLITVNRNYDDDTATVCQKKYLSHKSLLTVEDDVKWWIPLSYTFEREANFNETRPKNWIRKSQKEIVIKDIPADGWVLMNIQISGVYRVNYDDKNWMKLIETLNKDHKKIGLLNRAQLVDDSFALAKTSDINYSVVFNIINYFKQETEYLPWRTVLRGLAYLDRMLRFSVSYDTFREYIKNVLEPIYTKLANTEFENAPQNLEKIKHQKLIQNWACKYGVGNCRAEAVAAFMNWMKEENADANNPIQKDSRPYIYCTAIKYGGEEEWNFLWKRYLNANVGSERNLILNALGCTREVWLLNRYLEWSLTKIRRQDSTAVFNAIARGDVGYFLAKSFFMKRIAEIREAFGPNGSRLGLFVNSLANQVTEKNELADLEKFTKEKEEFLRDAHKAVEQSLENAKINVQWRENFQTNILAILDKVMSKKKND